jgi:hypothetical protein
LETFLCRVSGNLFIFSEISSFLIFDKKTFAVYFELCL